MFLAKELSLHGQRFVYRRFRFRVSFLPPVNTSQVVERTRDVRVGASKQLATNGQRLQVQLLGRFKPLLPPKNISGLYIAGLLHTLSGFQQEVLPAMVNLNGTMSGSQFTILLPVFNPLSGPYSQLDAMVDFSPLPVTVQSSKGTYELVFGPGTVHLVAGHWVIDGEYVGVKTQPIGPGLPVTKGLYRFTRL